MINCKNSVLGLGLLAAITATSPAHASLANVFIVNNKVFTQNDANAPTIPSFYFYNLIAQEANLGDFDGAVATYPGPASPQNLTTFTNQGATGYVNISYDSPGLATAGEVATALPFGSYSFTATNSMTSASQTGVVDYTADLFTTDIPTLGGGLFAGFDPSKAFHVSFNPFTLNPASNQGLTFFSIYDMGGSVIASYNFLGSSTTGVDLTANLLQANTQYLFELDFSDRLVGFDSINNVNTLLAFDQRTDGAFTTGSVQTGGVPEPVTWSMMIVGFGLVGATMRRRVRGAASAK